jgi:hypothetical protein
MKRLILLVVLILGLTATYSYAENEGHMTGSGMMGSPGYGEAEKSGSQSYGMMGQGMGRGGMGYGGYGMMNPNMMGRMRGMMGYGMGSGMMGGMGQGMMGPGGCDMMGGGMGTGMMGHHQMMHGSGSSGMMGEVSSEEQQKFLNDTVDLRKKLMMKRFDYREASRNPETKPETFKEIKKDMWELQKQITDKRYE